MPGALQGSSLSQAVTCADKQAMTSSQHSNVYISPRQIPVIHNIIAELTMTELPVPRIASADRSRASFGGVS
ncbi:hypothetical protein K504DRAFT_457259 [Pleomassaria siparia CBS 279.74]|uniref:Uncharacterized protein n=1 Tax=Pleomassaria siparia CBS 279.74 TaxID=1314801 RepID=A0A6G1KQH5_9PLEO|nr:hypothetical protein K504DRAFT_457259 [Pleomassaria siparia CBS 279.74]